MDNLYILPHIHNFIYCKGQAGRTNRPIIISSLYIRNQDCHSIILFYDLTRTWGGKSGGSNTKDTGYWDSLGKK